jgi:hypothetical protein
VPLPRPCCRGISPRTWPPYFYGDRFAPYAYNPYSYQAGYYDGDGYGDSYGYGDGNW